MTPFFSLLKDPHNKWFVPQYMFNEKKFPNYLSGTGYLMHRYVGRYLGNRHFQISSSFFHD